MSGPEPVSPTWPSVRAFASLMEHKLAQNRHKGDREGWLGDNVPSLFAHLKEEVHELATELAAPARLGAEGTPLTSREDWRAWTDRVALEAADVGNMALMVADAASHQFALDSLPGVALRVAGVGALHPSHVGLTAEQLEDLIGYVVAYSATCNKTPDGDLDVWDLYAGWVKSRFTPKETHGNP